MNHWPDQDSVILPTRAYLRSVLEQNIPSRRLALADSVRHWREAAESDDAGWADMAFLGVVADTMQLLEDVAYLGESFSVNRFEGLPFYVGAITFSGSLVTTFYQRRRSDDDLRVVSSFALRDPGGNIVDPMDLLASQMPPATRAAWEEAIDATVSWLAFSLAELRDAWERFSKYFHAFKHGGLTAHRPDLELISVDGDLVDPAIAVWIRRKHEAHAFGDAGPSTSIPRVVRQLEEVAERALEVMDLLVTSRLGLNEHAAANTAPVLDEVRSITWPVRFKFGPEGISESAMIELEGLGLRFAGRP